MPSSQCSALPVSPARTVWVLFIKATHCHQATGTRVPLPSLLPMCTCPLNWHTWCLFRWIQTHPVKEKQLPGGMGFLSIPTVEGLFDFQ